MRKISCGVSGSDIMPITHKLSEIPLKEEIIKAFKAFYRDDILLRPAQDAAIFEDNLLAEEHNIIVTTPTNSGKSLLAYLLLFKYAVEGKSVVLVEPLRALAYEKSEELKLLAKLLKLQSHIKVKITISTGDYRLTDEFMGSKPGSTDSVCGQIIVATPERLDAISRVKENEGWFNELALVCFDEAHLIGDSNRGPTLELLIAYLRTIESKPRIMLMSATIANPEILANWLSPCKIISAGKRYPKLEKWIYCIEEDEEINDKLISEVKLILEESANSVIIFVYQTASAESLANTIAKELSGRRIAAHDLSAVMSAGVAWFHANMSNESKRNVINGMTNNTIRVTVATTALAMGINLPATHVFVRDVNFAGVRELNTSDLLQMLGRAGRGERNGVGVVWLSGSGLARECALVDGLSNETLPIITSGLLPVENNEYYGRRDEDYFYIDRLGSQLIGALHRYKFMTRTLLSEYFDNTLCGKDFGNLDEILRKLINWKLVYQDEVTNEYCLTVLGGLSSRCYLPPLTAGNIGGLIRDLLSDEPSGKHIKNLKPIDYLIILSLCSNEFKSVARYGSKIETRIHSYMESLPLHEKSYLYSTWIATEPECLWGSARQDYSKDVAKKQVMVRTYTAMLVYDISKGVPSTQIKKLYGIDVEEVQEKLRDTAIWLLSGMEKVLAVRSFYYHLKENCDASINDIHKVDLALRKSSSCIFTLIGNLKFRSKLGEMIVSLKRIYSQAERYPGEGTIKKLELAGIHSLRDLIGKSKADLVSCGIRERYADMIVSYIRRRMQ